MCLQLGFIRSVENVMLTNIVNTEDGNSIVCDVWQMECHVNNIANGKAMYAIKWHRTHWECDRCWATWYQYCDIRSNLSRCPTYPTKKQNDKLINKLKPSNRGRPGGTYTKGCIPQKQRPQDLWVTQNSQKEHHLIPIISSMGVFTYGSAKELANILRQLVGHSAHQIRNTQDFVEQVKNITLEEGKYNTSYDVLARFTPVPKDSAITIIKSNWNRTQTSRKQNPCPYITLLPYCRSLLKTPFSCSQVIFMNRCMEQQWGHQLVQLWPTNSLRNWNQGHQNCSQPSKTVEKISWWHLFIQKTVHRDQFLGLINFIDPHIQFTTEDPNTNVSMLFFGHIGYIRTTQHPMHNSLQKSHPHRLVSSLVQSPQPSCKVQSV